MRDDALPEAPGLSRRERIDLGLAIASARRAPGERVTIEEIAAFCDCSTQNVVVMQQRALAKLAKAIRQRGLEDDLRSLLAPDQARSYCLPKPRLGPV